MMVLAVIGVLVNGAAVLKLRGDTSLNESVVSWHLLEDVLGWMAVLLGSVAMTIWGVPILDPLLSIAERFRTAGADVDFRRYTGLHHTIILGL